MKAYHLTGVLQSSDSSTALAFANLYTQNGKGTQSDVDGRFTLDLRAYKNDIITISYLGYENVHKMVQDFSEAEVIKLKIDDHIFSENIVITSYVKRGVFEGGTYGSLQLRNEASFADAEVIDQDVFRELQKISGYIQS